MVNILSVSSLFCIVYVSGWDQVQCFETNVNCI